MNIGESIEIWQVDAAGTIYEGNFDELTQWIAEGSLLPQDKVKKGNLRWIEANKIPSLNRLFTNNSHGATSTTQITATATNTKSSAQTIHQPQPTVNHKPKIEQTSIQETVVKKCCLVHIETPAKFVCSTCANVFCPQCPQSFGTVKLCPMCGEMCLPLAEVAAKSHQSKHLTQAAQKGFGFADFLWALTYPLKFKASLIFGIILYTIFSFGQNATGLGGGMMFYAAIFCWMLANTLTFGILSNVVENMLQGKTDKNFMPGFDEFDLWNDVIHPFFLNLGTYVVSFGAFIAIAIVAIYFVANATPAEQKNAAQKAVQSVAPGMQSDLGAAQQTNQIKAITDAVKQKNQDFIDQTTALENPNPTAVQPQKADEQKEFQKINEMIAQAQKQQLESTIGKIDEPDEGMFATAYKKISSSGGLVVLLAGAALIWALFYFPSALITAAYTRNMASVLNPLVGIDTIKRLGFDYAKILIFGTLLAVIANVINAVLSRVFVAFNLPRFGNLPAILLGCPVTFYLSIVFSLILGAALYKNSKSFNLLSQ